MTSRWLNNTLCLLILVIGISGLSSCASVKAPDDVADRFWNAMIEKDEAMVRSFATEETRELIDLSDFPWHDVNVLFDEIRIKGDNATIETNIEQTGKSGTPAASFQTVLKRQDGTWRVDYEETMRSVSRRDQFSGIIRDLRKFNRDLSENLDDALSNLKKEAPKLEREMESLGNTIKKHVEEFAKELDKLLKDSQTRRERQMEKDPSF